jgi:hypothetical protein
MANPSYTHKHTVVLLTLRALVIDENRAWCWATVRSTRAAFNRTALAINFCRAGGPVANPRPGYKRARLSGEEMIVGGGPGVLTLSPRPMASRIANNHCSVMLSRLPIAALCRCIAAQAEEGAVSSSGSAHSVPLHTKYLCMHLIQCLPSCKLRPVGRRLRACWPWYVWSNGLEQTSGRASVVAGSTAWHWSGRPRPLPLRLQNVVNRRVEDR